MRKFHLFTHNQKEGKNGNTPHRIQTSEELSWRQSIVPVNIPSFSGLPGINSSS
jgi:hypothetical protein